MRKLRIFSQIFFLVLFMGSLLFLNTSPRAQFWESEWFLRLNPLPGLLTSLASRQWVGKALILAIPMSVVTLIFGRFFCGFMCPLGALVDFFDWSVFKRMRIRSRRPSPAVRKLKYFFLLALACAAVCGALVPFFMDPILLLTRITTLVLFPAFEILGITGKEIFAFLPNVTLSRNALNHSFYLGSGLAFVLFVVILGGGFWDRRFWCQYVCPSGAFFGILSRFAVFRRKNCDDACNGCSKCAKMVCPTRAIDEKDPAKTSTSECILCGVCTDDKRSCSVFRFQKKIAANNTGIDFQRRHFVAGTLGGLVLAPVVRSSGDHVSGHDRIIRPPGAVPENLFLNMCITCDQCVNVCPNNAIQPCTLRDGFSRVNTPKVVASIGYCDPECRTCSHVCPTGALHPVAAGEKGYVKIGTARVTRGICLAWNGSSRCLVCMAVCPWGAISVQKYTDANGSEIQGPFVDDELCVGCGKCENKCPTGIESAISVVSDGQRRVKPGEPYVRDKKKTRIDIKRSES